MTHLDIIIITGTLFISSTLGVYAALRYINQHTNPAMNTLTRRSGDIELQYIEPSTNNNLDLLQPQQVYISEVIPERVPCTSEATYNTSKEISSSFSANPPSYNNLDLLQPEQVYIPSYQNSSFTNFWSEDSMNIQSIPSYINCCLENSINLNYIILFIIIFMVVLSIIFYLKRI
jgi:hypothetical protein